MIANTGIAVHSLSKGACQAVERGHPWVFGEDVQGAEVGQMVNLSDANGRVLGWGLVDVGAISHRVLGRSRAPKSGLNAVILDRLKHADNFRFCFMPRETDAYRVVSGAGDGLPGLVVDRYANVAVIRIYSSAWLPYLSEIVRGVRQLPWVDTVWRKFGVTRVDGKKGGELLAGPDIPAAIVVVENGVRYLSRPLTGQKTGLFLDQRVHRDLVRQWSSGRQTINLFAYNGGFSVAAALGGASHVITVDIAPEAIEDAKEIFRLNGLEPDRYGFEVADAFKWKPVGKSDLVIVDPPSLAKEKGQITAGLRAYRNLHRRVANWLPREGLLATASCTSWIKRSEWMQVVEEGLCASGAWSWHWTSTQPLDHPVCFTHHEAQYLKFGLARKR